MPKDVSRIYWKVRPIGFGSHFPSFIHRYHRGNPRYFFVERVIFVRFELSGSEQLILCLMSLNKMFQIIAIHEHFPTHLNKRKLTVPYLASPEPLGYTNFIDQLFDRVESFLGHIVGTAIRNHLIYLLSFWAIGLDIQGPSP
jgi:hypothetical protein